MTNRFSIARMANEYQERFKRLSPVLFGKIVTEAKVARIPDLGDLDFTGMETVMDVFASNLTYHVIEWCERYH
jgi:hypothetical protein